MGRLYALQGFPRSGKSTWAMRWQNKIESFGTETTHRVVLADDYIRWALYNKRYDSQCEPMVFSLKHIMIKTLLTEGYDVLVDDTKEESIKRLFELDINTQFKCIDTSALVCQQRALDSHMPDLIPVIAQMSYNLKVNSELEMLERIEKIRKKMHVTHK